MLNVKFSTIDLKNNYDDFISLFLQPDERYRLADPICTFLFSIVVLVTTFTVLRDTLLVMMEGEVSFLNMHLCLVKVTRV